MRLGNPQPNSSLALELDTADPHLGNDIDREMLCTETVNFGLVAVGDVKLPTYRTGHCFVSVRCRNKTPTGTCTCERRNSGFRLKWCLGTSSSRVMGRAVL